MKERQVLVKDLIEANNLEVVSENGGFNNVIKEDQITSPGLIFTGFYEYYFPGRIMIVGSQESKYLYQEYEKNPEEVNERLEYIFSKRLPVVVFSVNVDIPKFMLPYAEKYNVTLLRSNLRTTGLTYKLYTYLESVIAQRVSVHGVLVDINGMGTLITGKSGIGKSEVAMELIKRGHQLVSDDRVDIFEREPGTLVGEAPSNIAGYIEVRGVGIVNVLQMFGASSYRENKKIRLVIELESWDKEKDYDRIGIATHTVTYFNTELPKIIVPVSPGRTVASLVEAAAMQQKLKYLGYDAAKDLIESISKQVRGEK